MSILRFYDNLQPIKIFAKLFLYFSKNHYFSGLKSYLIFMKKIILFLLLICVVLAGCKPKLVLQETTLNVNTTLEPAQNEMEITIENFMFPSDVLYVISREFELIHDSTSLKSQTPEAKKMLPANMSFQNYMEKRLVELYPNKAFKGMMADFCLEKASGLAFLDSRLSLPENSELVNIKSSQMAKNEPFYLFISIEDEMDFMDMNERERSKYLALNELATNENFAKISDFNNIKEAFDSIPPNLDSDDLSFFLEENVFLSGILFASGGAYIAYRVKQNKERAVQMAQKHYPDNISCGKKGDAFKHLTISMLLKRYLTEEMSYLILDLFWENRGNNSPCDKHMDLHNNHVGRVTKYSTFRGNENPYDWKKWIKNIHNFVENEYNAIEKPWNKEIIEYVIEKDTKTSNKSKYIFWNNTTECE